MSCLQIVKPLYLENFLMQTFSFDTFEIIDKLEKDYHMKKIIVDTKDMRPFEKA